MIANKRQMGEKAGYWFGIEVERTPFYGQDTVFYSRFTALDICPKQPHVFVCLYNPKFSPNDKSELLWLIVAGWIERHSKRVTIEVTPEQMVSIPELVKLRRMYPTSVCILVELEVPQIDLGAFCIKAVPSHPFENRENESHVATVSCTAMEPTYWNEYEGDQDGQ